MEFNFKEHQYLTNDKYIKESTSVMYKILYHLTEKQREIILCDIFEQLNSKLSVGDYDYDDYCD